MEKQNRQDQLIEGEKEKMEQRRDFILITSLDALASEVALHVHILNSAFSWMEWERSASIRSIVFLAKMARFEDSVDVIVNAGAVQALVQHLRAPPFARGDASLPKPFEHEAEKRSALALGLIAVKPEHRQLIVDAGGLSHLVDLLKRHKHGSNSRAINSVIRRAADAIANLASENSSIKTCVRLEGGIPPLVELLEFADTKIQRAAAGALRTLAFKDDANKNQIVEGNALPSLVLMLRSEDAAIRHEAVSVIGNLVHSSPNIMKEVLLAGALQPVIGLLSLCCSESQREAALLLGQFAATDSDCKVHIVQRGAFRPLIGMLQSPNVQLRETTAFALGRFFKTASFFPRCRSPFVHGESAMVSTRECIRNRYGVLKTLYGGRWSGWFKLCGSFYVGANFIYTHWRNYQTDVAIDAINKEHKVCKENQDSEMNILKERLHQTELMTEFLVWKITKRWSFDSAIESLNKMKREKEREREGEGVSE